MHKETGFTIIEVLIVAIIVFVIGMIVFSIARALNGGNYCDMYRYSSIQDTPVSCYNYLTGEGSQQ